MEQPAGPRPAVYACVRDRPGDGDSVWALRCGVQQEVPHHSEGFTT